MFRKSTRNLPPPADNESGAAIQAGSTTTSSLLQNDNNNTTTTNLSSSSSMLIRREEITSGMSKIGNAKFLYGKDGKTLIRVSDIKDVTDNVLQSIRETKTLTSNEVKRAFYNMNRTIPNDHHDKNHKKEMNVNFIEEYKKNYAREPNLKKRREEYLMTLEKEKKKSKRQRKRNKKRCKKILHSVQLQMQDEYDDGESFEFDMAKSEINELDVTDFYSNMTQVNKIHEKSGENDENSMKHANTNNNITGRKRDFKQQQTSTASSIDGVSGAGANAGNKSNMSSKGVNNVKDYLLQNGQMNNHIHLDPQATTMGKKKRKLMDDLTRNEKCKNLSQRLSDMEDKNAHMLHQINTSSLTRQEYLKKCLQYIPLQYAFKNVGRTWIKCKMASCWQLWMVFLAAHKRYERIMLFRSERAIMIQKYIRGRLGRDRVKRKRKARQRLKVALFYMNHFKNRVDKVLAQKREDERIQKLEQIRIRGNSSAIKLQSVWRGYEYGRTVVRYHLCKLLLSCLHDISNRKLSRLMTMKVDSTEDKMKIEQAIEWGLISEKPKKELPLQSRIRTRIKWIIEFDDDQRLKMNLTTRKWTDKRIMAMCDANLAKETKRLQALGNQLPEGMTMEAYSKLSKEQKQALRKKALKQEKLLMKKNKKEMQKEKKERDRMFQEEKLCKEFYAKEKKIGDAIANKEIIAMSREDALTKQYNLDFEEYFGEEDKRFRQMIEPKGLLGENYFSNTDPDIERFVPDIGRLHEFVQIKKEKLLVCITPVPHRRCTEAWNLYHTMVSCQKSIPHLRRLIFDANLNIKRKQKILDKLEAEEAKLLGKKIIKSPKVKQSKKVPSYMRATTAAKNSELDESEKELINKKRNEERMETKNPEIIKWRKIIIKAQDEKLKILERMKTKILALMDVISKILKCEHDIDQQKKNNAILEETDLKTVDSWTKKSLQWIDKRKWKYVRQNIKRYIEVLQRIEYFDGKKMDQSDIKWLIFANNATFENVYSAMFSSYELTVSIYDYYSYLLIQRIPLDSSVIHQMTRRDNISGYIYRSKGGKFRSNEIPTPIEMNEYRQILNIVTTEMLYKPEMGNYFEIRAAPAFSNEQLMNLLYNTEEKYIVTGPVFKWKIDVQSEEKIQELLMTIQNVGVKNAWMTVINKTEGTSAVYMIHKDFIEDASIGFCLNRHLCNGCENKIAEYMMEEEMQKSARMKMNYYCTECFDSTYPEDQYEEERHDAKTVPSIVNMAELFLKMVEISNEFFDPRVVYENMQLDITKSSKIPEKISDILQRWVLPSYKNMEAGIFLQNYGMRAVTKDFLTLIGEIGKNWRTAPTWLIDFMTWDANEIEFGPVSFALTDGNDFYDYFPSFEDDTFSDDEGYTSEKENLELDKIFTISKSVKHKKDIAFMWLAGSANKSIAHEFLTHQVKRANAFEWLWQTLAQRIKGSVQKKKDFLWLLTKGSQAKQMQTLFDREGVENIKEYLDAMSSYDHKYGEAERFLRQSGKRALAYEKLNKRRQRMEQSGKISSWEEFKARMFIRRKLYAMIMERRKAELDPWIHLFAEQYRYMEGIFETDYPDYRRKEATHALKVYVEQYVAHQYLKQQIKRYDTFLYLQKVANKAILFKFENLIDDREEINCHKIQINAKQWENAYLPMFVATDFAVSKKIQIDEDSKVFVSLTPVPTDNALEIWKALDNVIELNKKILKANALIDKNIYDRDSLEETMGIELVDYEYAKCNTNQNDINRNTMITIIEDNLEFIKNEQDKVLLNLSKGMAYIKRNLQELISTQCKIIGIKPPILDHSFYEEENARTIHTKVIELLAWIDSQQSSFIEENKLQYIEALQRFDYFKGLEVSAVDVKWHMEALNATFLEVHAVVNSRFQMEMSIYEYYTCRRVHNIKFSEKQICQLLRRPNYSLFMYRSRAGLRNNRRSLTTEEMLMTEDFEKEDEMKKKYYPVQIEVDEYKQILELLSPKVFKVTHDHYDVLSIPKMEKKFYFDIMQNIYQIKTGPIFKFVGKDKNQNYLQMKVRRVDDELSWASVYNRADRTFNYYELDTDFLNEQSAIGFAFNRKLCESCKEISGVNKSVEGRYFCNKCFVKLEHLELDHMIGTEEEFNLIFDEIRKNCEPIVDHRIEERLLLKVYQEDVEDGATYPDEIEDIIERWGEYRYRKIESARFLLNTGRRATAFEYLDKCGKVSKKWWDAPDAEIDFFNWREDVDDKLLEEETEKIQEKMRLQEEATKAAKENEERRQKESSSKGGPFKLNDDLLKTCITNILKNLVRNVVRESKKETYRELVNKANHSKSARYLFHQGRRVKTLEKLQKLGFRSAIQMPKREEAFDYLTVRGYQSRYIVTALFTYEVRNISQYFAKSKDIISKHAEAHHWLMDAIRRYGAFKGLVQKANAYLANHPKFGIPKDKEPWELPGWNEELGRIMEEDDGSLDTEDAEVVIKKEVPYKQKLRKLDEERDEIEREYSQNYADKAYYGKAIDNDWSIEIEDITNYELSNRENNPDQWTWLNMRVHPLASRNYLQHLKRLQDCQLWLMTRGNIALVHVAAKKSAFKFLTDIGLQKKCKQLVEPLNEKAEKDINMLHYENDKEERGFLLKKQLITEMTHKHTFNILCALTYQYRRHFAEVEMKEEWIEEEEEEDTDNLDQNYDENEYRIDTDGGAYTKQEFYEHYNGYDEWNVAFPIDYDDQLEAEESSRVSGVSSLQTGSVDTFDPYEDEELYHKRRREKIERMEAEKLLRIKEKKEKEIHNAHLRIKRDECFDELKEILKHEIRNYDNKVAAFDFLKRKVFRANQVLEQRVTQKPEEVKEFMDKNAVNTYIRAQYEAINFLAHTGQKGLAYCKLVYFGKVAKNWKFSDPTTKKEAIGFDDYTLVSLRTVDTTVNSSSNKKSKNVGTDGSSAFRSADWVDELSSSSSDDDALLDETMKYLRKKRRPKHFIREIDERELAENYLYLPFERKEILPALKFLRWEGIKALKIEQQKMIQRPELRFLIAKGQDAITVTRVLIYNEEAKDVKKQLSSGHIGTSIEKLSQVVSRNESLEERIPADEFKKKLAVKFLKMVAQKVDKKQAEVDQSDKVFNWNWYDTRWMKKLGDHIEETPLDVYNYQVYGSDLSGYDDSNDGFNTNNERLVHLLEDEIENDDQIKRFKKKMKMVTLEKQKEAMKWLRHSADQAFAFTSLAYNARKRMGIVLQELQNMSRKVLEDVERREREEEEAKKISPEEEAALALAEWLQDCVQIGGDNGLMKQIVTFKETKKQAYRWLKQQNKRYKAFEWIANVVSKYHRKKAVFTFDGFEGIPDYKLEWTDFDSARDKTTPRDLMDIHLEAIEAEKMKIMNSDDKAFAVQYLMQQVKRYNTYKHLAYFPLHIDHQKQNFKWFKKKVNVARKLTVARSKAIFFLFKKGKQAVNLANLAAKKKGRRKKITRKDI